MRRAITTLGVLGLTAFAVAAPAVADRGGNDDDKIAICHAGSGSHSGKFSAITVAVPSLNGHGGHGDDIIPPTDGKDYGQNWNAAGKAIYASGCVVSSVPVQPVVPPVVVPPVVFPPVVDQPVLPPIVVVPPAEPPAAVPPIAEHPVAEPPAAVPPVAEHPVAEPPAAVPPVVEQPGVVPSVTVPPAATPVVVPDQRAAVQPEAHAPQAGAAAPAAATSRATNQGYNAQTAVNGSDAAPSWLAGVGALLTAGGAVASRRRSRAQQLAG